ncbi:MAG: hypothetical protein KatS3mg115_2049 [Candidatus Poribacteria bacterium]|nr:MAG: hypothetical protein KatS3mg115_2049 [Candidatus Poribacteria bacterium]
MHGEVPEVLAARRKGVAMRTPSSGAQRPEQMRLLELPYRVGIIGCGGMAHGHAQAYQAVPRVQLVCCADIDPQRLESFRRQYHIPFGYTDYREMLQKERPDLVSIVTWPGLHSEMTLEAARAGVRGILCEKPLALTLEEADRMLQVCQERGTILLVNHQRRWDLLYETARDLVQAGEIGQLLELGGSMVGSDLFTDATHAVDLFRFFNADGGVDWVYAQVTYNGRVRYGHPVEDLALVTFRFENGSWATLRTGRIPEPSFEKGIPFGPVTPYCASRLVGTRGVLEVSGDRREPRLYLMRSGAVGWKVVEPGTPHAEPAMVRSIRALLRSIEEGTPHRNDAFHGRAAIEVIIAALLSAAERAPVRLPLKAPGLSVEALFEQLRADSEAEG